MDRDAGPDAQRRPDADPTPMTHALADGYRKIRPRRDDRQEVDEDDAEEFRAVLHHLLRSLGKNSFTFKPPKNKSTYFFLGPLSSTHGFLRKRRSHKHNIHKLICQLNDILSRIFVHRNITWMSSIIPHKPNC